MFVVEEEMTLSKLLAVNFLFPSIKLEAFLRKSRLLGWRWEEVVGVSASGGLFVRVCVFFHNRPGRERSRPPPALPRGLAGCERR